jgi:hypothetical protein
MTAGRRAAAAVLAALTLLAAACARRAPPSGGPPDLEPPTLIASTPDSGSAAVPLDQALSVTFSEGMERRSTEDAVDLSPRIPIARRRWSGHSLTLELSEPLQKSQTYSLSVAGTARDRHGNAMGSGATVVFSTADSFPPGRIAGKLEGRGLTAEGITLWCYEAAPGRVPDSTARDFDALGQVDRDGMFRIDGLAVPGEYRLWAFADLNQNRSFEPAADVLAAADTVLGLTRDRPVLEDLEVRVVNPRAPGRVRGAVLDSLADSAAVVQIVAVSERDSSLRVIETAQPDGSFEIELAAGTWLLRAIHDLNRDRIWQVSEEPASDELRLVIEPAADIVDLKLRLRPRAVGP